MKKQRSLTEAVCMSVGFNIQIPNDTKALTSQRLAAANNVLHCFSLLLAESTEGSASNRPIVRRCVLTGACPVRIATTILS
jgi:hypothetical protein